MPETLKRLKQTFKEKGVEVIVADDPEQTRRLRRHHRLEDEAPASHATRIARSRAIASGPGDSVDGLDPVAVGGRATPHGVEVGRHDRRCVIGPMPPLPTVAMVDRRDRRDLRAGAAEEDLVGDVELAAVDVPDLDVEAQLLRAPAR